MADLQFAHDDMYLKGGKWPSMALITDFWKGESESRPTTKNVISESRLGWRVFR
jgi:hypothetical protein